MYWIVVVFAYLLGSIPSAYLAGRWLKDKDIRRLGDGNVGARNAFIELGPKTGVVVFAIDVAKGMLAIIVAQSAQLPQLWVWVAGIAVVIGHIWPLFLSFRGGRGESTTIGVLLTLIPGAVLIVAIPSLVILIISKNVILTSAVLFISLPVVDFWLHIPTSLILYGIALPILVASIHFFRTRKPTELKDGPVR